MCGGGLPCLGTDNVTVTLVAIIVMMTLIGIMGGLVTVCHKRNCYHSVRERLSWRRCGSDDNVDDVMTVYSDGPPAYDDVVSEPPTRRCSSGIRRQVSVCSRSSLPSYAQVLLDWAVGSVVAHGQPPPKYTDVVMATATTAGFENREQWNEIDKKAWEAKTTAAMAVEIGLKEPARDAIGAEVSRERREEENEKVCDSESRRGTPNDTKACGDKEAHGTTDGTEEAISLLTIVSQ